MLRTHGAYLGLFRDWLGAGDGGTVFGGLGLFVTNVVVATKTLTASVGALWAA